MDIKKLQAETEQIVTSILGECASPSENWVKVIDGNLDKILVNVPMLLEELTGNPALKLVAKMMIPKVKKDFTKKMTKAMQDLEVKTKELNLFDEVNFKSIKEKALSIPEKF